MFSTRAVCILGSWGRVIEWSVGNACVSRVLFFSQMSSVSSSSCCCSSGSLSSSSSPPAPTPPAAPFQCRLSVQESCASPVAALHHAARSSAGRMSRRYIFSEQKGQYIQGVSVPLSHPLSTARSASIFSLNSGFILLSEVSSDSGNERYLSRSSSTAPSSSAHAAPRYRPRNPAARSRGKTGGRYCCARPSRSASSGSPTS